MISIDGLGVSLGGKRIIDGLSVRIPDGIICLSGRSGCGKTTLLRCIAGLMPYDGAIKLSSPAAIMFQEDRLLPWLTARRNIEIMLPQKDRAQVGFWLEAVGLGEDGGKYPSELSGGMQRRVALARALAKGPGLLLLDEPFTGLDASTRSDMMRIIRVHGHNALIITHDGDTAALADGLFACDGPPLQLWPAR